MMLSSESCDGLISTFDEKLWTKDLEFEATRNIVPATEHPRLDSCIYLDWKDLLDSDGTLFKALEKETEQHFCLLPDGDFAKNLYLDVLLIRRDSNKLLVVFHGALDRDKYVLPRFEFKNTLKHFDGSVLFISDPTLQTHNSLGLGWYIGNAVDNGHELATTLVKKFALNLDSEKIVLTGSSGGGYAALATSFHIKGSVALPFSPQTSVEGYWQGHRTRLMSSAFSTWVDPKLELVRNAVRFDLGALYSSKDIQNKIWFIQNTGDSFHVDKHCIPFAKSRGIDISRGQYVDGDVRFDLVYYREGHKPPLPETMNSYISRAFETFF